MFAGLPKLFDRSFFIGYFLPAFLLVGGIAANLFAFGRINEKVLKDIGNKDTLAAVVALVLVWLLSILLMTFSRAIIRLLEGYGDANPFRLLWPQEKERFRAKAQPQFAKVDNVLGARRRGLPERDEFEKLDVWRAALEFPERMDLVLPTRLGNVMRAYERYSAVVYGIEAIVMWPRLMMVIPAEARESLRDAEALFYFSINMLLVGAITILTTVAMTIDALTRLEATNGADILAWPVFAILAASLFFIWFSWIRLPDAARARGDQVKSMFDLYRKPLAKALGFDLPETEAEERNMWELISRRMLLRVWDDRLPGYRKSLDDFRSKGEDAEEGGALKTTSDADKTKEAEESKTE
jgi:hypothetical protein